MLELERDRDRNRQPVSVCVFPDRVFLFPLLIFFRQFIPLSSPFEALDDERFSYGPGPWQVKLAIAETTPWNRDDVMADAKPQRLSSRFREMANGTMHKEMLECY